MLLTIYQSAHITYFIIIFLFQKIDSANTEAVKWDSSEGEAQTTSSIHS